MSRIQFQRDGEINPMKFLPVLPVRSNFTERVARCNVIRDCARAALHAFSFLPCSNHEAAPVPFGFHPVAIDPAGL
jgi:hypothetical protein